MLFNVAFQISYDTIPLYLFSFVYFILPVFNTPVFCLFLSDSGVKSPCISVTWCLLCLQHKKVFPIMSHYSHCSIVISLGRGPWPALLGQTLLQVREPCTSTLEHNHHYRFTLVSVVDVCLLLELVFYEIKSCICFCSSLYS